MRRTAKWAMECIGQPEYVLTTSAYYLLWHEKSPALGPYLPTNPGGHSLFGGHREAPPDWPFILTHQGSRVDLFDLWFWHFRSLWTQILSFWAIFFKNFGALRHKSAGNEIYKLNLENKDHIYSSHNPFNQSFWVKIRQFQLCFRVESRSFWVHFFTSGGASLSFSGQVPPPREPAVHRTAYAYVWVCVWVCLRLRLRLRLAQAEPAC